MIDRIEKLEEKKDTTDRIKKLEKELENLRRQVKNIENSIPENEEEVRIRKRKEEILGDSGYKPNLWGVAYRTAELSFENGKILEKILGVLNELNEKVKKWE